MNSINAQCSKAGLTPTVGITFKAKGQGVGAATAHLLNISNTLNKCWYIAMWSFRAIYSEFPISI
jgi:hypothetical protein